MNLRTGMLMSGILVLGGMNSCAPVRSAGPQAAEGAYARPGLLAEDGAAAMPAERPGLATGWGERKNSSVYGRGFERGSSRPAGVDAIYYNNPEGIKAMAVAPRSVSGMQMAAGGLVEWGIKGRWGMLPAYKDDSGRRLVAGSAHGNYGIRIKNRSRSSLEVVASVDGLDVMDGAAASYSKRGYVIAPGQSLDIDGFRTSMDQVAAFEFSSVANSYANLRHGDTRNVGVIGLAVFTEKGADPWRWMPDEPTRRLTAQPFATPPM